MSEDVGYIPPQDLGAEQNVLGSMIVGSADAPAKVAELLCADDFCVPRHKLIAEACFALHEQGKPIDVGTCASYLLSHHKIAIADSYDYFDRLQQHTPFSINVPHYAAVVRDKSLRRQIIEATYDIQKIMRDEGETAEQRALEAADILRRITDSKMVKHGFIEGAQTWQDIFDTDPDYIKRTLPTGFPTIDEAMGGGIKRKQVYVLAGHAKKGKTGVFCQWMSDWIRAGFKVGYISLEGGESEVQERMLSIMTGIPKRRLAHRDLDRDDRRTVKDCIAQHFGNLIVTSRNYMTIPEMIHAMRAMKEQKGCDVVILDHFGRIRGDGQGVYDKASSVNAALQELGHPKGLGIPILVSAHIRRDLADASGLKGGGDLAEQSPTTWILTMKKDPSTGDVTGVFKVEYQRDGPLDVQALLSGDSTWGWSEEGTHRFEPVRPHNEREEDPDPFWVDD